MEQLISFVVKHKDEKYLPSIILRKILIIEFYYICNIKTLGICYNSYAHVQYFEKNNKQCGQQLK